jgi:sodium/potassium/calcium exchanger 5
MSLLYVRRFLAAQTAGGDDGDGGCDMENFCLEQIDGGEGGGWPGVVAEVLIAAYSFVGIAKVADAYLAVGLETLCERWSIPEDVAGASFMAFASAAPEIIINAISTVKGMTSTNRATANFSTSLGIASILGSGMMAFTLIPGICALGCKNVLKLTRRPLARDIVAYSSSIIALQIVMHDGVIDFTESVTLLAIYAIYLAVVFFAPMVRKSLMSKDGPMVMGSSGLGGGLLGDDTGDAEADDDDDDDDEPGPIGRALAVPFAPLMKILEWTCPECEHDSPAAHLYPITLFFSFFWLALFSATLSACVTRWGNLLSVSAANMGMYVVAVGAQIPDTLQALAVARRGHGSMAIASATGSQVINVLIGLGLPWAIATTGPEPVVVNNHHELTVMNCFMAMCVIIYTAVLLLPSIPTWGKRGGRAMLGRREGIGLIVAYALVVSLYQVARLFTADKTDI